MKTVTEIQNEVAQAKGYDNWHDAMYSIPLISNQRVLVDLAMQEYAKQIAVEQRQACSQSFNKYAAYNSEFVKSKIISTPLVTDNI